MLPNKVLHIIKSKLSLHKSLFSTFKYHAKSLEIHKFLTGKGLRIKSYSPNFLGVSEKKDI